MKRLYVVKDIPKYQDLNDIGVNVIEIEHRVVDSIEYEEIRDKVGIV